MLIQEDDEEECANEEGGETESREHHGEGKSVEERHSLIRVPDSRIRKIASSRQAVARRWKKASEHSCSYSMLLPRTEDATSACFVARWPRSAGIEASSSRPQRGTKWKGPPSDSKRGPSVDKER